jgi:hypothetical protein
VPLNVPELTGGVIAGRGSIGSVVAGGIVVAGLGSGSMTACALSAKVKERTAAAQSAIAEVKKCDFVFMTRTLSAAGKHRQRGVGNAIVTLVTEQFGTSFETKRTGWPNESFYEGKHAPPPSFSRIVFCRRG